MAAALMATAWQPAALQPGPWALGASIRECRACDAGMSPSHLPDFWAGKCTLVASLFYARLGVRAALGMAATPGDTVVTSLGCILTLCSCCARSFTRTRTNTCNTA